MVHYIEKLYLSCLSNLSNKISTEPFPENALLNTPGVVTQIFITCIPFSKPRRIKKVTFVFSCALAFQILYVYFSTGMFVCLFLSLYLPGMAFGYLLSCKVCFLRCSLGSKVLEDNYCFRYECKKIKDKGTTFSLYYHKILLHFLHYL